MASFFDRSANHSELRDGGGSNVDSPSCEAHTRPILTEKKIEPLDAKLHQNRSWILSFLLLIERFSLLALFPLVIGVRAEVPSLQTITWLSPTQQVLTPNLRFPILATSSSGLPLIFSVEHGPAIIEGENLIVTGIGSVHVAARQVGTAEFEPAILKRTFNIPVVLLTTVATLKVGTGVISDLVVEGDYAFITLIGSIGLDASGLFIIDVKDSFYPKKLGYFATLEPRAIRVVGNYAYIAGNARGLQIVDISVPSNPTEIANVSGKAWGLDIVGSLAYLVEEGKGLQIIDISSPFLPIPLGSCPAGNPALGVTVVGGYAYVANGDAGFSVIDVTDPTTPFLVATQAVSGFAFSAVIRDDFFYAADGYNGFDVFNVSVPTNMVTIGNYHATDFNIRDLRLQEDFAYVPTLGALHGFRVFDVSDPTEPMRIDAFAASDTNPSAAGRGIGVVGTNIFYGDLDGSLHVVHSRVALPQPISLDLPLGIVITNSPYKLDVSVDTSSPVTLTLPNGNAILSGNQLFFTNTGLVTVRASQPGDDIFVPSVIQKSTTIIPAVQTISWLGLTNEILRLGIPYQLEAFSSAGLPITYEVVAGPAEVDGAFVTATGPGTIWLTANQTGSPLYAPTSYSRRFNSQGIAFSRVGYLKGEGVDRPGGIEVFQNRAYVAGGNRGLLIFDVGNPIKPTLIGVADQVKPVLGLDIAEPFAYLATEKHRLQILDMSNPAFPVYEKEFFFPSEVMFTNATGVKLLGSDAWMLDGELGIYRVDVSNVSDPKFPDQGLGPPNARFLKIIDGMSYIGIRTGGVLIANLATGGVGRFVANSSDPYGLQLVGSTLIVADFNYRLQLVDLASSAQTAVNFPVVDRPLGIEISNSVALIPCANATFKAINTGNPLDIFEMGEFHTLDVPHCLQIVGDLAFLAEPGGALEIVQFKTGIHQTIQFNEIPAPTSSSWAPLTAFSSSGLPVLFSVISGPATVVGDQLTISQPGHVTVRAEQSGDQQILPASSEQKFTVPGFLSTRIEGDHVQLSWAAPDSSYKLQSATSLNPPVDWTDVTETPNGANGDYDLALAASATNFFYRLSRP